MFSLIDNIIGEAEHFLRCVAGDVSGSRPSPTVVVSDLTDIQEGNARHGRSSQTLSPIEMLKINHCGEICAQALYRSQALITQDAGLKQHFQDAAREEIDHLDWCNKRLGDLAGKPSITAPLWYISSFVLGLGVGVASDKISLSFVEKYEHMVADHLADHLKILEGSDPKTAAIFKQMHQDELEHAQAAGQNVIGRGPGGNSCLEAGIDKIMLGMSKAMKFAATWI